MRLKKDFMKKDSDIKAFHKIILDIGSGSGYLTACFGEAVKVYHDDEDLRGKVVGLEVISKLVQYSINILKKNYNHLYRYKRNFKILSKDGKLGHPLRKNEEICNSLRKNENYLKSTSEKST